MELSPRALLPSRLTATALTATAILAGIGIAIYRFAAVPADKDIAFLLSLLMAPPESLKPEPQENLAYLAVLASVPFVFGLVWWLIEKLKLRSAATIGDVVILSLLIGVSLFALHGDPVTTYSTPSLVELCCCASAAALLGVGEAFWAGKIERLRRAFVLGLVVLALGATAWWRVIDASSVIPHLDGGHWDAFASSIVQTAFGGTCLVTVAAQYGCYGELVSPLIHLFGSSFLAITTLTAVAQFAALCSVIFFCAKNIRSTIILIGCVLVIIVCENRIFFHIEDPYFQYAPLRFLFPAISLVFANALIDKLDHRLSFASGIFGAFAIFANFDSGLVVAGALGSLIVIITISNAWSQRTWKAVFPIAAYLGAVVITAVLLFGYLSLKGGRFAQPLLVLEYTRIFAISGFMMLPMPTSPAAWMVMAVVIAVGFSFSTVILDGKLTKPALVAAYLGVLASGLLGYYVGRSHPLTLSLSSWAALLLLFFLMDQVTLKGAKISGRVTFFITRSLSLLVLALACAVIVSGWPELYETGLRQWKAIVYPSVPSDEAEDVNFIKKTSGDLPFEVLAEDAAIIRAETGSRSAFAGPGMSEILLKKDAESLIEGLVDRGPRDLFIRYELVLEQKLLTNVEPWVANAIPKLRTAYILRDWGPGGRIMHFVRKPAHGPDLLDLPYKCPQSGCDGIIASAIYDETAHTMLAEWGRPTSGFGEIVHAVPAPFRLDLSVTVRTDQVNYATVVSTHRGDFVGFVLHHLPGTTSQYQFTVGDGARWLNSQPFEIVADKKSTIVVCYDGSAYQAYKDGMQVANIVAPYTDGYPLTVGDVYWGTRLLNGTVSQLTLYSTPLSPSCGGR